MRAANIAVAAVLVIIVLMAAAVAWLVLENSQLAAQNSQLTKDTEQYRRVVTGLLEGRGHFAVSEGWSGEPHVVPVKRSGADTCFECHQETECSDCHIKAK